MLHKKGDVPIHYKWRFWRHQGCWDGKVNKFLTFNLIRWPGWVWYSQWCYVGVAKKINVRTTRSTFHIPKGYTFIWNKLQDLLSSYEPSPDLDGGSQELDWTFVRNRRLTMISTNDAYHKLIYKHRWMEERVIKIWGFRKPITWWFHVIKAGWCFRFVLRAKVFIWRVMVGVLSLADKFKKRNISRGTCFFCSVEL